MNPEINRKRVLFVITQTEFGGAQRFLYELITRLNRKKYEILVAAGEDKKGGFLKLLAGKNINVKRLKFLKRGITPVLDCLGIIELLKLINNFKPDYLHLNSSKAGFLGSIAGFKIKLLRPKKFKDLKIIYRIGGWSFNDPRPWREKKFFLWSEKITAGLKDVIVVNNKQDYDQAIELAIKPKRELKLIHNGIDALKIDFLPKEEARLKLFKNLSKKQGKTFQADFIIGTVANFYPTKGLRFLIDAMHLLKNYQLPIINYQLFIIGDGRERKNLELKIDEYELKNKIFLLGQIPEAHKYLKAFDIFVLPSAKEGFPWVILEAMAAKTPIVATNVGALPEIIENGPKPDGPGPFMGKNGILVEPKNPRQMAEAIKYLLENRLVRDEFTLRAHQTVLFKFPIEKMVRETETLFN